MLPVGAYIRWQSTARPLKIYRKILHPLVRLLQQQTEATSPAGGEPLTQIRTGTAGYAEPTCSPYPLSSTYPWTDPSPAWNSCHRVRYSRHCDTRPFVPPSHAPAAPSTSGVDVSRIESIPSIFPSITRMPVWIPTDSFAPPRPSFVPPLCVQAPRKCVQQARVMVSTYGLANLGSQGATEPPRNVPTVSSVNGWGSLSNGSI